MADNRFRDRWFVGDGIDIGCGDDPLDTSVWVNARSVRPYDRDRGDRDGQFLEEVADGSFNFVHSSHCLEHLENPRAALHNWLRVLKPGGFIVCTIPEELYYEFAKWPSRWNPDHKNSFTMRSMPLIPTSQNVLQLLWRLPADVEHVTLLSEHWDPKKAGEDQTLGNAECAIEFVVRKQLPEKVMPW